MNKILFLLILLVLSSGDDRFTLINTVKVNGDFYCTDHLENIYAIKGQQITKFDSNGNKITSYSNSYLGNIFSADVSDPLRILLFYKDFNQIMFLDNTLAGIKSPIILDDLGIEQVRVACSSKNGGFWIFNDQTYQLMHYDRNLELTQQSINLGAILKDDEKPEFLYEKANNIYMNVPNTGILVFDQFGAYYKTISLKGLKHFQISGDNIVYMSNNSMVKYNRKLLSDVKITLPDTNDVIDARIGQTKLFIIKKEKVSVYRINK